MHKIELTKSAVPKGKKAGAKPLTVYKTVGDDQVVRDEDNKVVGLKPYWASRGWKLAKAEKATAKAAK